MSPLVIHHPLYYSTCVGLNLDGELFTPFMNGGVFVTIKKGVRKCIKFGNIFTNSVLSFRELTLSLTLEHVVAKISQFAHFSFESFVALHIEPFVHRQMYATLDVL